MSDENEKEYTLAGSKLLGPLRLVFRDPNGRIIDGFHRLQEDSEWPTVVRTDIDTERKYWAAKILLNTNRRSVSVEETIHDVSNLADAIRKELGQKVNIVKQICEDTGLTEKYIRIIFSKSPRIQDVVVSPKLKGKRTKKKEEEDSLEQETEEEEGTKVSTLQQSSRDTEKFQWLMIDIVQRLIPLPIDQMIQKMVAMPTHDLIEEEARGYIERFKMMFPEDWSRIYDSNDQVIVRDPTSTKAAEVTKAPEKITFSGADDLSGALDWYPEKIVTSVWPLAPPNKKVVFLKTLFVVMWEAIPAVMTPEQLYEVVKERLS